MEFELQSAVERDPQPAPFRFTRRLVHLGNPGLNQFPLPEPVVRRGILAMAVIRHCFDGAKLGVRERFNGARNGSSGCGSVRGFRLPVRKVVQFSPSLGSKWDEMEGTTAPSLVPVGGVVAGQLAKTPKE